MRAEEDVQKIDVRAAERDDEHARRKRGQIEGREARILAQDRGAADEPRQKRNGKPDDEAAEAHRRQRQAARYEEAERRAGQHRVAHRVADEAHAPQEEEHTERTGADAERHAGDERAPHEAVFDEGLDEDVVEDHATLRTGSVSAGASSSHRSAMARARTRLAFVMTDAVGPQPIISRAMSSVSGKCVRT